MNAKNKRLTAEGSPERFVRGKTGRIQMKEQKKIFFTLAIGRPPEPEDLKAYPNLTKFWNWFRVGIRIAQDGKATEGDVRWVRRTFPPNR